MSFSGDPKRSRKAKYPTSPVPGSAREEEAIKMLRDSKNSAVPTY